MSIEPCPKMPEIDERYIEAAMLRIFDGQNWGQVAETLGIDEKTLYRWRQEPEWKIAVGD